MVSWPTLPELPEWVDYPSVVWFVLEGVALVMVGFFVRDVLGGALPGAVRLGNVVLFVGSLTALFGVLAYVVLVAFNR